jgi:EmrB/QacA subfamily drug resistance transporter
VLSTVRVDVLVKGSVMSGQDQKSATHQVGTGEDDAGRARRLALALVVIVTCQLMVVVDGTIVSVALPEIQRDLDFSAAGVAWVQVGYSIAFGGLLLLGGRAGDAFGRQRMFMGGLALFTLASLGAGLATSGELLIVARAFQGVGAAFAAPASLALLAVTFKEGPERQRALGMFSMVAGLGLTIGFILGGVLATISWRWLFFINVPFGIAAVVLARQVLTETQRHRTKFDVAGAVVSAVGVAALAYGFIRASSDGWSDGLTVGSFIAAAVLLVAFAQIETRATQPIVAYKLLAQRLRASAYLNMLLLATGMAGATLYVSIFLQNVLGFTVLRTGLAFLPMAAIQFAGARTAPKLLQLLGPKRLTTIGTVAILASTLWMINLSDASRYPGAVLGPLLLLGVGIGVTFMPLNALILAGLPPRETGSSSGLLQCLQQIGAAMGVAVLTTVYNTTVQNSAGDPASGRTQAEQVRHAMGEGIGNSMIVTASLAAVALLVAVFALTSPKRPAVPAQQKS